MEKVTFAEFQEKELLTNIETAKVIGVGKSYVSQFRTGVLFPGRATLRRIRDLYPNYEIVRKEPTE